MGVIHATRRPVAGLAVAVLLGPAGLGTLGCESLPGSKTTQGAVGGAVAGAALGRAIGGHEHAAAGIAIGAAAGALTGGLIGRYLDNQQKEIDAIPDANVERREDRLLVSFSGDVLFDTGSARLSPGAQQRLGQLAQTLVRYPESNVIVNGHTDAVGDESYNLRLSESRAQAVANYLIGQGVAAQRLRAVGHGEQFPVASNATEAGRQQNRRVDIEIVPIEDQIREEGY
jgi:outer membrane protein OmpA-like peptidoglycan-associated protein